jgi:transposase
MHSDQIPSRRRFKPEEKLKLIRESEEPGNSLSTVSRKYGIHVTQLYYWRRLMKEGQIEALVSQEKVVPLSELKALEKKIKDLERILGRKSLEIEVLKEAVTLARKKKLISQEPLHGVEDFE